MKKTLVLGASEKKDRYSNMAIARLVASGHEVVAIGRHSGQAHGVDIFSDFSKLTDNIDTVTLYLNPENQKKVYGEIIALKPRRIIFNPGTENQELQQLALLAGIESEEACTLVLLNTNQY